MEKREFVERIGKNISDADYGIIETVYQWHPSIRNVSGKEEVAELYKSFGMTVFFDMLPRAEKACELEKELCHAQSEVERIKDEIKGLFYSRCMQWGKPPIEYLVPLVKWEDIKIEDGKFVLGGCTYQDGNLMGYSHAKAAEYAERLVIFNCEGKFITEINKDILEGDNGRLSELTNPSFKDEGNRLADWEKFRKENGLYSAAIYDAFWVDKFKEIYGYEPE